MRKRSVPRARFRRVLQWLSKSLSDPMPSQGAPWLRSRELVGLGIAPPVKRGIVKPGLAIKAYVRRKRRPVECDVLIDAQVGLTGSAALPVDVEELGDFRVQSGMSWARPLRSGLGIGLVDGAAAGTLGCFVREVDDDSSGRLYLLTCAHVLAESLPPPGGARPVVQPPARHGGLPDLDRVATTARAIPIEPASSGKENVSDAALARVLAAAVPALDGSMFLPSGTSSDVRKGRKLRIVGASSGNTVGRVVDPDFRLLRAEYPKAGGGKMRARFSNVVLCTKYGSAGDSGAAIYDSDDRVLGLHMGSFRAGSVFCKIDPILQTLGVELVTR